MKKKSLIAFILTIVILAGCNIYTFIYFDGRIQEKNEELKEAYTLVLDQKDQINVLEEIRGKYQNLVKEHETLAQSKKVLEQKNTTLLETYQALTAQFESLKLSSKELEQQLSEVDQIMDEYSYVFDYDSATLEEYQVYIQELEERIIESGGFDKYEEPKRWKDYGDIVLWLEDGSSVKWADQAITYLRMLPKKALETLNQNDWKIIITPRSLEEVYESGVPNTVGLTIYYRSRIYIQNNTFSIEYCTIHEVAHALDFINNFISYDDEWKLIYETEAKNSGLPDYFTSSNSEYFAEMVQSCYLDPEGTQERAPQSYEFIMKFMDQYK